jgi:hypothetical protein
LCGLRASLLQLARLEMIFPGLRSMLDQLRVSPADWKRYWLGFFNNKQRGTNKVVTALDNKLLQWRFTLAVLELAPTCADEVIGFISAARDKQVCRRP